MAQRGAGRRIPFAFLAAVQEAFAARYSPEQVAVDVPPRIGAEFRGELQALVEKYNSPDADRVARLNAKVADINDRLMESVDKILERQERIELLVDRSEVLSSSSRSFRAAAQDG
ncbi:unnamed protein product, partial [Prorocentrum cordatum]